MDVEDWYHLDYFQNLKCDRLYSMLDGLENYAQILELNEIKKAINEAGKMDDGIRSILDALGGS